MKLIIDCHTCGECLLCAACVDRAFHYASLIRQTLAVCTGYVYLYTVFHGFFYFGQGAVTYVK